MELDRLSELLAITFDWSEVNRRRIQLIDLEEDGQLTPKQSDELADLQRLADAQVSYYRPVQMEGIDKVIVDLKRRGLWEEK